MKNRIYLTEMNEWKKLSEHFRKLRIFTSGSFSAKILNAAKKWSFLTMTYFLIIRKTG
jgi:hypothetical protein